MKSWANVQTAAAKVCKNYMTRMADSFCHSCLEGNRTIDDRRLFYIQAATQIPNFFLSRILRQPFFAIKEKIKGIKNRVLIPGSRS